jgi:hypothetical protein
MIVPRCLSVLTVVKTICTAIIAQSSWMVAIKMCLAEHVSGQKISAQPSWLHNRLECMFKRSRSSKTHLGDGPEGFKAVQVLTGGPPSAALEGGGALLLTTHHHQAVLIQLHHTTTHSIAHTTNLKTAQV